ncbi:hypothetical protein Phum_PHUM196670 [Pediculus humanus corporis]|uniref:SMP-LTD domain-containing protein n=1 Tax=Pediculus humanus subsp. corporis TaxID=121224 RepID=E0VH06_PEDHC|nr:uncharacterized protein Phum_PHUM196670 [Pediculus humanus corporis]EEB12662.1 hypothetical protein Phum_PHUM196670 [Pediculus humanus corporis]
MSESSKIKRSISPQIGYRFDAISKELEEISPVSTKDTIKKEDVNSETKLSFLPIGSLEKSHSREEKSETHNDCWTFSGRSISVDCTYESPFSNPFESWKKLTRIRGKLNKNHEEKLAELQSDKKELNKNTPAKLTSSKDNSSMSDSEDTSESSKISEQWKDSEDLNLSLKEVINKTNDMLSTTLDAALQNAKSEIEAESELRHRVNQKEVPDFLKISQIKIITPKTDNNNVLTSSNVSDEIESGVEADENFDSTSGDALDDSSIQMTLGGSQPPPNRNEILSVCANIFSTMQSPEMYTITFLIGISILVYMPMSDFARGFVYDIVHQGSCAPDYKKLPPLKIPSPKNVDGVWVNEYLHPFYDPDYYSVSQTTPAYLELDNTILKLSRPKGKIRKRATFDEPEYKMQFISQRIYNIGGCNVFLMPEGLTKKRLYSKKYPIVIHLKSDSFIGERMKEKDGENKENTESIDSVDTGLNLTLSNHSKTSLYIFARCDRQKEEWYRRLLSASRAVNTPEQSTEKPFGRKNENESLNESPKKDVSTPFEKLYFDPDTAQIDEYLQYMAKFVDEKISLQNYKVPRSDSGSDESSSSSRTYSKMETQWLNAFLNRILFDVFRSPYWLSKIQEKIHKKLNSVRLPYYIEDIEVIELDLGKTGPIIHKVSQPYIDECGLWFDMDVTFEGLIKLTIQTHLNLVKLQKGIEEERETLRDSIDNKVEKGKKKSKILRERSLTKESSLTPNKVEKSSELKNNESVENEFEKSITKTPPSSTSSSLTYESKLYREIRKAAELIINRGLESIPDRRSPIFDSEVEDSAESSDEELDDNENESTPSASATNQDNDVSSVESHLRRYPKNRRSSKKLFRMFENVAQSKYFKSVAQTKYVQKAIANVSATNLKLTLEIKSCSGTLAVNIPPPPSDRFWYGFREMPFLVFSANPKIGEKSVRFSHIKNYLQKKILHELKKAMVVPNMIDLVLFTSSPKENVNFEKSDRKSKKNDDEKEKRQPETSTSSE